MGYKPLDFIIASNEVGFGAAPCTPQNAFETIRQMADILEIPIPEDVTEEEYLRYVLGPAFLLATTEDYVKNIKTSDEFQNKIIEQRAAMMHGYDKFKSFEHTLLTNDKVIETLTHLSGKKKLSFEELMTEYRDSLAMILILNKWCRNKQVYKIDSDFSTALIHTENLKISKESIDHLPANNFYIDLTDCKGFYPMLGIWVDLFPFNGGFSMTCYCFVEGHDNIDDMCFSSYNIYKFGDDNTISVKTNEFKTKDLETGAAAFSLDEEKVYSFNNIRRADATILAAQLINYMTSQEPDINESPITKSTYKKTAVIKNKFSEVQQWDVGIRFGKALRQQAKEYKDSCRYDFVDENGNPAKQKRKSPVAHFRCAHWQHYWHNTPNGKERFLRWKEPKFVGGNFSKDIVVHNVG